VKETDYSEAKDAVKIWNVNSTAVLVTRLRSASDKYLSTYRAPVANGNSLSAS